MSDRFAKQKGGIDSIITDAFTITPSTSLLDQPTRAIYVGAVGNLVVEMVSYDNANTQVTFVGVQAGTTLPIRVKKVLPATTAGSLVGLF